MLRVYHIPDTVSRCLEYIKYIGKQTDKNDCFFQSLHSAQGRKTEGQLYNMIQGGRCYQKQTNPGKGDSRVDMGGHS